MKLSVNKSSPHYHDVQMYVSKVLVDGVEVQHCTDIDTLKGVTCFKMPINVVNEAIETEFIPGKVEIVWRESGQVFNFLREDWRSRENNK